MRLKRSLKVERLERGMSQKSAAEAAEVTQSTWSRAERGRGISPGEMKKIADFLACNVADVWDLDGEVVT